jgi:hypothetical protein
LTRFDAPFGFCSSLITRKSSFRKGGGRSGKISMVFVPRARHVFLPSSRSLQAALSRPLGDDIGKVTAPRLRMAAKAAARRGHGDNGEAEWEQWEEEEEEESGEAPETEETEMPEEEPVAVAEAPPRRRRPEAPLSRRGRSRRGGRGEEEDEDRDGGGGSVATRAASRAASSARRQVPGLLLAEEQESEEPPLGESPLFQMRDMLAMAAAGFRGLFDRNAEEDDGGLD